MQQKMLVLLSLFAALGAARRCINATVPVSLSVEQPLFGNLPIPHTQVEVTAFLEDFITPGVNLSATAISGMHTVAGTFNISTTFCMPDRMPLKPVVQVMTHGVCTDKRYWDWSFQNYNYSYAKVAADDHGYCTLTYDRLGVGNSSHGDARDEIQATLQVAALNSLTTMLREGVFPGVHTQFDKVVHVGHSFGSIETYLLSHNFPTASDALVLTGWSPLSEYIPDFTLAANLLQANLADPLRFGGKNYLADGNFVTGNTAAIQSTFLKAGFFDPELLPAFDAIKQTVGMGEYLSLPFLPTSSPFAGPVLVVTGNEDLPFCGYNCTQNVSQSPTIPALGQAAFPYANASFQAYVQENMGHGNNFHYNRRETWDVIHKYLAAHGLGCN